MSFNAPKAAPSGKEWICIFIQTNAKIKFSQVCAAATSGRANMLMFMLTSTWNGLGFVLKTARFNDSVDFLLRDNNFIHGALSDLKTLQDVFINLELCYTLELCSIRRCIITEIWRNEYRYSWPCTIIAARALQWTALNLNTRTPF